MGASATAPACQTIMTSWWYQLSFQVELPNLFDFQSFVDFETQLN